MWAGRPIPPKENRRLVIGKGLYVDDVKMKDCLYLGVVRSPYSRGLIKSVDIADAMKKAVDVLTLQNVTKYLKNVFLPAAGFPNVRKALMPVLANDRVNFVGQPVVAVLSDDPYKVADLLELVNVDYEPLEPVLSVEEALSEDAPIIHPEIGSNVCVSGSVGGDVEEVFRSADHVVQDKLYIHRVAHAAMEPRGGVAYLFNGKLHMHVSAQGALAFKQHLLENLNLSPEDVRVVQTDVGGGFGSKTPPYPEHVLIAVAALKWGRPVKWVESRRENLTSAMQGRDMWAEVALASTSDGTILGLKAKITADIGAYAFSVNPIYSYFTAQQLTGPYKIKAAHAVFQCVYTNKTPTGPYRGFSRPESCFIYERAVDLLADELKMDPVELRIKNLVRLSEMPFKSPLGIELDREDYVGIMNEALAFFNYDTTKKKVEEERRKGKLIGLGVCNYVELVSAALGGGESAFIKIDENGKILFTAGIGPQGQSLATTLSQLVADEMDVDIDDVEFLGSDSSFLSRGMATVGSRSIVIGGEAVIQAARKLKEILSEHASTMLNTPPEELKYVKGRWIAQDGSNKSVSLKDIVSKTGPIQLEVFVQGRDIFSYGVHMAIVEVDPETGLVSLLDYRCVDDAGRVVNPLVAEAQIVGGVAQAIGQVLYEAFYYDENGQPQTVSLADLGIPTAVEIRKIISKFSEYPSMYSHSARGIGEAGTVGGISTLVRAVENAVGTRLSTTNLNPQHVKQHIKIKSSIHNNL